MKKLFVQFYLLLFVCFLVMTMLVGLVYKFTAERAGRQSLDDLMKSSLYLMRSELREIPPHDWARTLKELDLNLSFDLRIEPMKDFDLAPPAMQRLRDGDIVALDEKYTFIQRIPRSHYVLAVSASALSLLPAPDAPAGSRPAGLYCHLARFPCVHLDATALAGHAETGIRRTAFWGGSFN